MKIAFDEHIAKGLVEAVKVLSAGDHSIIKCEILSVSDIKEADDGKSDAPWIKRFAAMNGTAIISGDARMRSVPQEREAILESGLTIFFFKREWNKLSQLRKSGFLLCWWSKILARAESGPVACLEIPLNWTPTEFKEIQIYEPKK